MNRLILIALSGLLWCCGGSLSEEQRKEIREGREQQAIQRISEAEILEMGFSKGREIIAVIERGDSSSVGVINKESGIEVHWLPTGSSSARAIEQQLIEAYIVSAVTGSAQPDNVQPVGTDSLLYTRPVLDSLPDGSVSVLGTWNVWMAKKQLILERSKKK